MQSRQAPLALVVYENSRNGDLQGNYKAPDSDLQSMSFSNKHHLIKITCTRKGLISMMLVPWF